MGIVKNELEDVPFTPEVLTCEGCGWQSIPSAEGFDSVTHHRMQKVGHPFANLYILCDSCVKQATESGAWVEHPLHFEEEE